MTVAKDKLLLLAGTPPGNRCVGEIILRDLISYYGADQVHCVAIVPARYTPPVEVANGEGSVRLFYSKHSHGARRRSGRWGAPGSHLRYLTGFQREVAKLVAEIAREAKQSGSERIFAVLDNPLMMALAHRVATATRLPLVSLVWDPPEYVAQLYLFDRWSRRSLVRQFRTSLAASSRVAVVSETMQRDYSAWTEAPIHLLRHGVQPDSDEADLSSRHLSQSEWVIGFAGSMYSDCAWRAFLAALDSVGWRVAGRPVRLKVLARRIEVGSRSSAQIEYLGFRPPEQVQDLLAGCHVTYMPQPFVEHLRELCRYSFPTKLSNYLALGRPVFVHSPSDSALSAFYVDNPIGAHAASLEPQSIIAALESLLSSDQRYLEASRQVRATAKGEFSDTAFHAGIDQILGVERMDEAVDGLPSPRESVGESG